MIIKIGFSPCPNDTYIFDAMVHKKIDTKGLLFEPVLADVQTLNEWALQNILPISKISFGVLPSICQTYKVLEAGSALGNGVGPLLVGLKELDANGIDEATVAIPGENTTAHLLFSLAYPYARKKVFLRYDEIEGYVLNGNGPGVIIHENRFTYAEKGLVKIMDLGSNWEEKIKCPIPLGGIVVQRSVGHDLQMAIDDCIKRSLIYANENYGNQLPEFVKCNAQEMSQTVMRKHIDLYVNKYSLSLGPTGQKAIRTLIKVYQETSGTSIKIENDLFVG